VDLTVRAWRTHVMGGKSQLRGRLNLRHRAPPQLGQSAGGGDETEALDSKGRMSTASRVTSRVTAPVQTRLQAFLQIGHSFKGF